MAEHTDNPPAVPGDTSTPAGASTPAAPTVTRAPDGPAPLVRRIISGGVATLTMDSFRNRNTLSLPMLDQLIAGVTAAAADPTVRVIMLTHTGPVFCSGADLSARSAAGPGETGPGETGAGNAGAGETRPGEAGASPGSLPVARLGELLAALCECRVPVIARVAGPARGGGLGLIAAADLAVCTTGATFAFSEVRVGVIPSVISAVVLPRLANRAAAELYLTGAIFDGVRAKHVGLVSAAVPDTELDHTVDGYVTALLRGAPGALSGVKQLLRRPPTGNLRDQLRELTQLSVSYFTSSEGIEGAAAFREKRDPRWTSVVR